MCLNVSLAEAAVGVYSNHPHIAKHLKMCFGLFWVLFDFPSVWSCRVKGYGMIWVCRKTGRHPNDLRKKEHDKTHWLRVNIHLMLLHLGRFSLQTRFGATNGWSGAFDKCFAFNEQGIEPL